MYLRVQRIGLENDLEETMGFHKLCVAKNGSGDIWGPISILPSEIQGEFQEKMFVPSLQLGFDPFIRSVDMISVVSPFCLLAAS